MKNLEPPSASVPTLLFVTDFSDSSLRALQWAIPEAAHRHLHLSVLYAYRLDQARKVTVMSKKDMDGEAAEKFEAHAEKVLRKSGVTFEFHSEVGFIRDRVSEHAKRNNVVLVVMGEKIASAESFPELLREVRVPVVIVPSGKITSSLP